MGASLLIEPRQERQARIPDPDHRRKIEAFLVEARPWALRQARRRYPHLPRDIYEDVYQQACIEMLTRGPESTDQRSMYAYLAKVLTGVLGRAHKGWVHDHGQLTYEDGEPIPLADSGPEPDSHYDRRHLNALLSELMQRSLLAPEKAVLQLQLGAGLDPDQVRAALDMTPRQYKRRRSEGLEKLRGALDDYLNGRVCEEHADLLAMAATGEITTGAAEQLHAHLEHCGGCRAEVKRLKSVVHARFAFAPWPLTIGAPGFLAAKLSAVGAWFGGKAAATGGAAKLAGALAAAAVIGTGTVVVVSGDEPAKAPTPAGEKTSATAPASRSAGTQATQTSQSNTQNRSGSTSNTSTAKAQDTDSNTVTTPTVGDGSTASAADQLTNATKPLEDAVTNTAKTVRETAKSVTDTIRKTTKPVTKKVPKVTAPGAPTVDPNAVVDDATGAVDDAATGLTGGG